MDLELERFRKRILSLKESAYLGKFIILPFYDETKNDIIRSAFSKNDSIFPVFYGGYEDAEYKRSIFSYLDISPEMFEIDTLKINYSKLAGIFNHRDVLGSVLGLGLKREMVGDIIFNEDDCYIFVCSSKTDFIIENLHYIKNIPVNCDKSQIDFAIIKKYEEKLVFAKSLRLDLLISAFYNLSRKESLELIQNGLVKVNHKECMNNSFTLKEKDLVSVRGKGRMILDEIKGKSKSDNYILNIKKPID